MTKPTEVAAFDLQLWLTIGDRVPEKLIAGAARTYSDLIESRKTPLLEKLRRFACGDSEKCPFKFTHEEHEITDSDTLEDLVARLVRMSKEKGRMDNFTGIHIVGYPFDHPEAVGLRRGIMLRGNLRRASMVVMPLSFGEYNVGKEDPRTYDVLIEKEANLADALEIVASGVLDGAITGLAPPVPFEEPMEGTGAYRFDVKHFAGQDCVGYLVSSEMQCKQLLPLHHEHYAVDAVPTRSIEEYDGFMESKRKEHTAERARRAAARDKRGFDVLVTTWDGSRQHTSQDCIYLPSAKTEGAWHMPLCAIFPDFSWPSELTVEFDGKILTMDNTVKSAGFKTIGESGQRPNKVHIYPVGKREYVMEG